MNFVCGGCGARIFANADWCTQCFAPASDAVPATVPATVAVAAPEPAGVAARTPRWSDPDAELRPAPTRRPTWEQWGSVSIDPAPAPSFSPAQPPVELGIATQVDDNGGAVAFGVRMVMLSALAALLAGVWSVSGTERHQIVRAVLWLGVGMYVYVGARVWGRIKSAAFQPLWATRDTVECALTGVLVGGGIATLMAMLWRQADGRVLTDDGINFLISEGTPIRIGLAFLLLCVAAPWVEEALFRGHVAEGLRARSVTRSIVVSSVLFSLWHPQSLFATIAGLLTGRMPYLGQFVYYVIAGAIFWLIYTKRGLVASIAAHTAFNGVILITTLTVAFGPHTTLRDNGVTAQVPGTWRHITTEDAIEQDDRLKENAPFLDFVAEGPSGSALLVMHMPSLGAVPADVDALYLSLTADAGDAPFEGTRNAKVVQYPFGAGVQADVEEDGEQYSMILVPRSDFFWMIMLAASGSDRAERDFEAVLKTLTLPEAPLNGF